MSMLDIDQVSLSRNGKRLLSDISVSVNTGELVAILGPNGAGKSTLFRTICGEYQPDYGTVSIDGRNVEQWLPAEKSKTVAVLPQVSTLSFPFSVLEVVKMGRYPHNTSDQKNNAIAEKILLQVEALHLRDENYTTLSGGEKQRIHFARILAQLFHENDAPDRLLLLDEPTSALDPAHQQQTIKIARQLTLERTAVLVILHDLNLAARYADRIILLQEGRKVADGKPHSVLVRDVISDVFAIDVMVSTHEKHGCPVVIVS